MPQAFGSGAVFHFVGSVSNADRSFALVRAAIAAGGDLASAIVAAVEEVLDLALVAVGTPAEHAGFFVATGASAGVALDPFGFASGLHA